MPDATLSRLAAAIGDAMVVGDGTISVSHIGYDSRSVTRGSLFVALRGGDFDGHRFVDAAVANGAAAVMVEERMPVDVPQILVAGSSRAALAKVAAEFYGHPSRQVSVIGITGTDGKTTTTAMLEGILAGTGHQVGAIGTVGIRIGNGTEYDLGHQTTPESVHVQRCLREMVDAGTRYAVVEATSHGLATHRLDGVRFVAGGRHQHHPRASGVPQDH